jgi:ABC-type Fe3+/spermidine/putrescine transport system ATPase subunit
MALRDVSFTVGDGEYVVVLGPSGCGKTTLLKSIAGVYSTDSGRVLVDGVDRTHDPPEERNIGFFFQHYALFPHMTVRENVGYSLRIRNAAVNEVNSVVEDNLRRVGLLEWADNYPHELSGGMQQRVALARALATGSKVMLLDEPLNALDARIAAILRRELREMSKSLGLTVIHVTPNQEEAMELADRVILMKEGMIVQVGSDFDCYVNPKTPYGAYFIGESNFLKAFRLEAHSVEYDKRLFYVKREVPEGDVVIAIRPEKVRFGRHEHNTLEGVVENIHFLGRTTKYEIECNGRPIYVETSKQTQLKECDKACIYFPPEDIMVFGLSRPLDDEITVV